MKKITLILSIFILIVSSQSYAQEAVPAPHGPEHLEQNDGRRDIQKRKKVRKRRAYKREVQRRHDDKRQMRAMKRVAMADGHVSKREKEVLRTERRKLKKRNKRRGIERKKNIRRSSEYRPDRVY